MAKKPACAVYGPAAYGNPWTIALTQQGHELFTVIYGLEVKTRLNYENAAAAFGEAVMHYAACESLIANREFS